MSDEIYSRFREFLDKLPGGYPATASGVEINILKRLFTPEEAEIAMKLTMMPEPATSIASRLGMSEEDAAVKLEEMALAGSILRVRTKDRVMFAALQFAVGIYEFHLNTLDKELAEMVEEYLPHLSKTWTEVPTKQLRVVPVNSSLEAAPAVETYDRVRELVKKAWLIAVAPCICTKEKELLGDKCSRPTERCVSFNYGAQYYIDNGMGREINQEELSKLLEMSEKEALVLSPTNAKDIMSICMCCGCCCGVLNFLRNMGEPARYVQTSFRASIDPELCSSCATCEDRCQIDAVESNGNSYEVDKARCIGCGLCVSTCPEEAITMVARSDVPEVPANIVEMSMKIVSERNNK